MKKKKKRRTRKTTRKTTTKSKRTKKNKKPEQYKNKKKKNKKNKKKKKNKTEEEKKEKNGGKRVGEQEESWWNDVVPDERCHHIAAIQSSCGPLELETPAVNHCCRGPGRDQERADPVNPWQDHSSLGHPATVVVAIDDRVNDLDVALDRDHHQTED